MELYSHLLKEAYNNYLGNPGQRSTINYIKAQMLQHQRKFSGNFRKINETFLSGESTTLFHVAHINGQRSKTNISVLVDEDGSEIQDQTQINCSVRTYFESLYASVETDENLDLLPIRTIPEHNNANENLMQPIIQDEIFSAITSSCSRKSPGSDGLPKEFYLKVWRIISVEFTNVINDALQGDSVRQFHDGIIVLVKKKGSDKSVKGYRPISLLNYDYKILARILKKRIQSLLPIVLSEHQKCSNGDRTIYEATCRIQDKICELKHGRKNALLVSFDLDHAFDRVSHEYLKRTMLRMNWNRQFVDLLTSMWEKSFSRILINGRLTQVLKIGRSVRQGDPLSMHLFVLYLQPLLEVISRKIPNSVFNAYADDISMFYTHERELVQVANIFDKYSSSAGAILNKNKTTALMIGNFYLSSDTEWLNIENFVSILGVLYGENFREAQKQNWQTVLNGLRTRLWIHSPRKLNLIQKTILINTYINSKIWYMASNIAISKGFLKKIKAEIVKFIWRGQTLQRIAMANLILPKNRGGLNLHCPELKSKALLINRLISLAHQLPFLCSFLENVNIPVPTTFSYIVMLKEQLPILPDLLTSTPSSQAIYQYYLQQLPDPGFVSAVRRDWLSVFKNVHCKALSSKQRSIWFTIIHKKIKHRELLFRRGVIDDPYCETCPEEPETAIHKLFRCQRVRDIWRFQRRQIVALEPRLHNYEPEDFMHPILQNINRSTKLRILKSLGLFFSYIIDVREDDIGLENFIFYITVNNY